MTMVKCSQCGHENLPSYTSCSKCGGAIGPGAAAAQAQHDYAKLMASRTSAGKRKKQVVIVAGMAVLGIAAVRMAMEHSKAGDAQKKLEAFDHFAELDKRETGAFWNCVTASEFDVNLLQNAQQLQRKIEAAYFTQQQTFSEHLLSECVPKIERARQAFGGARDMPPELAGAMAKYIESLPKLQTGVEDYAEKLKNRNTTKDVDGLIQEYGNAWHQASSPTPEAVGYERFIHCAVPGLSRMKDAQAMLEYLADQCFRKDPVKFMDRVRSACGPLLTTLDKGSKAPATWAGSRKRLYEEEARQLAAWESCGKKSRKGQKSEDMGQFLEAARAHLVTRADVVKAAHGIRESAK